MRARSYYFKDALGEQNGSSQGRAVEERENNEVLTSKMTALRCGEVMSGILNSSY